MFANVLRYLIDFYAVNLNSKYLNMIINQQDYQESPMLESGQFKNEFFYLIEKENANSSMPFVCLSCLYIFAQLII